MIQKFIGVTTDTGVWSLWELLLIQKIIGVATETEVYRSYY
jgi:hypothetical protein